MRSNSGAECDGEGEVQRDLSELSRQSTYTSLGPSTIRAIGGDGHFLLWPFQRVACIDWSAYNIVADPGYKVQPRLYQKLIDSGEPHAQNGQAEVGSNKSGQHRRSVDEAGSSKEQMSNLPTLLPDVGDGGWSGIMKASEGSSLHLERSTSMHAQIHTPGSSSHGSLEQNTSGDKGLASKASQRRKKKSSKHSSKWDLFPGIKVDQTEGMMTPLTPLVLISAPFRKGLAVPRKLKRLMSPARPQAPEENILDDGDELTRDQIEAQSKIDLELMQTFGHHLPLAEARDYKEEVISHQADVPKLHVEDRPQNQGSRTSETSSEEAAWLASRGKQPHELSPQANMLQSSFTAMKETGQLLIDSYGGIKFVNEYAVVRTLGRGSFGIVKLALNTQDLKLYALKLLPKSRSARTAGRVDPEVLHEIAIMKTLNHPNIVSLHEVIDDPLNSNMLMVLEMVEGGALFSGKEISPKNRISEIVARRYFRDVLVGLDYLHGNKVCHQDLKVDNLLLSSTSCVKIADFGSSHLTRRGSVVKRTAGTPAYMSPEVCSGEPYRAVSADVWSLGVCLYVFVFGMLPFKATSVYGLYQAILENPVRFPDDVFISTSLRTLLLRLLCKDPDKRISLVSAMTHPWVTHNGAYPLPSIQGLDPDEEFDRSEMLMECWPDCPTSVCHMAAGSRHFSHILHFVSPLFEIRQYEPGMFVVQKGEPVTSSYYLKEGKLLIYKTQDGSDEAYASDPDPAEEAHARLKDHKLLAPIHEASQNASRLVTAKRRYSGGQLEIIAERQSGSHIAETSFYRFGKGVWRSSVQAKGPALVYALDLNEVNRVIQDRHEAEYFRRSIFAQREMEHIKLGMLEQVASLQTSLESAMKENNIPN